MHFAWLRVCSKKRYSLANGVVVFEAVAFWQNTDLLTPSRPIGNICKDKQLFWTLRNSFFHKLYFKTTFPRIFYYLNAATGQTHVFVETD